MNIIILIMFLILMLLIIAKIYDINIKKIKQLAEYEETKFNKIVDNYPSNMEICKKILSKLKNESVTIEENKESKTCLYIALTNKIIIADVKNSYTRIQTIAHECLHSVQDRKILLFNFIFSNIYIIYFIVSIILALINKIQDKMLFLTIMIFLSYIYYFVRSYLENDAMIKAKYVAEEYMKEAKILSEEEIENIVNSYNKLNNIGIKTVNFQLMMETTIKTIILAIVLLI